VTVADALRFRRETKTLDLMYPNVGLATSAWLLCPLAMTWINTTGSTAIDEGD
jgi:hypothetical protein